MIIPTLLFYFSIMEIIIIIAVLLAARGISPRRFDFLTSKFFDL